MTEEEHLDAVARSGIIDNAWERYLMTGDPLALAIYVSVGGEIDIEIRELIAAHLRGETPVKYANRSNHWLDYKVFSDINLMRTADRTLSVSGACRKYVSLQGKLSPDKPAEAEGFEVEVERVRKQYTRGKKAGEKGGPVYDKLGI
jgi:hypothetical protein